MFRKYRDELICYSKSSVELQFLYHNDKSLAKVIDSFGGLEFKLYEDHYTFFLHTFIAQMLSNKVVAILSERFYNLCNKNVTAEIVASFSAQDLRNIGLSYRKANYIINFSKYILNEPNYFNEFNNLSNEEITSKLICHPGIGVWSAKMYLIFALGRLDVLPYEDGAFLQSVRWLYSTEDGVTKKYVIEQLAKNWGGYASLAARYLYKVLDSGLTKSDVNQFLK